MIFQHQKDKFFFRVCFCCSMSPFWFWSKRNDVTKTIKIICKYESNLPSISIFSFHQKRFVLMWNITLNNFDVLETWYTEQYLFLKWCIPYRTSYTNQNLISISELRLNSHRSWSEGWFNSFYEMIEDDEYKRLNYADYSSLRTTRAEERCECELVRDNCLRQPVGSAH